MKEPLKGALWVHVTSMTETLLQRGALGFGFKCNGTASAKASEFRTSANYGVCGLLRLVSAFRIQALGRLQEPSSGFAGVYTAA